MQATSKHRATPHVLHLIDHMGSGGAQRVLVDLLEARDPMKSTSVVSLRSDCLPELRQRMAGCGATYRGLGLSRRNLLPLSRVRRALLGSGADVVHSHLEFSNAFAVLAARSLGRRRPPVIVHLHNHPDRHYSRVHSIAGRLLAPWTDAWVAPSPSIARSARAAFGPRMGRIEVIPYGIDPAWLDRGRPEGDASFPRGSAPVIGTAARLVPQKSLHDLIAAMPFVLEALPSARLQILGEGPLRGELEGQTRRLGLGDNVTFAGFAHDIASAYAGLDVFVLSSRHEGLPISVLEVMAMGIPVVGTRVPGIADLVEDGRTGLTVPYGDPRALSGAVLRLLTDDTLRERVRRCARVQVERSYTRDIVVEQMESLYAGLAARRTGVAGPGPVSGAS